MALYGAMQAANTGERMFYGTVALDGSNPTPVTVAGVSGEEEIKVAFCGLLNTGTPPGDNTCDVACSWSGLTLNIEGYATTSGSDPTLVDSTGTETVAYWGIVGKL
jgi:hypothetical protein